MKQFIKCAFLLLAVLICNQGMAHGIVHEKTIWKLFQIDNEVDKRAVLVTDDYEIWLLHWLRPNRLTWNEWIWREEVPQPHSNYFFDVKKWEESDSVFIIYAPWQNSEWKDSYRNDTSLLQYCEYVIANSAHDVHVFAKPIQINEWMSLYSNLREEAQDLASRGFYGRGADLLKSERAFINFKKKISIEMKNQAEGYAFDEKYITFKEIYDLDTDGAVQ